MNLQKKKKSENLLSFLKILINNILIKVSDDITRRVIDNNNKKAELIHCLKVYNNNNENIGNIILSRINGYGGKIDVLVGFDLSLNHYLY